MKSLSAALLAHYAEPVTKFAHCCLIVRSDGVTLAVTSHDSDLVVDGVTYSASPGFVASSIKSTSGFAVGNMEIRTLNDDVVFTMHDIRSGVWKNARYTIFRVNFDTVGASPSDGNDELSVGTIGEVRVQRNMVIAELRDLRQYLSHEVGAVSSKTCRSRLGVNDGVHSFCSVNVAALEVTGTVTAKDSNAVFYDSSRTQADDYFGEGTVEWLTGANAGLTVKVRSFTYTGSPSVGKFTLALPVWGTIQVGDTYAARPGCRKRLAEDCVTKFDNVIEFNGEPHRPAVDDITKAPEIDV